MMNKIILPLAALVLISCTAPESPMGEFGDSSLGPKPDIILPVDGALAGLTAASFGNLTNGGYSSRLDPQIALSFEASKVGTRVFVYSDRYCTGLLGDVDVGLAGTLNLSVVFDGAKTVDGLKSFYFKTGDSSGPKGACASTGLSYNLDTKVPGSLVGRLSFVGIENNGYSSDLTPEIQGTYSTSEAGTTIELHGDNLCSNLLATTTVDSSGAVVLGGITYTSPSDDGFKEYYVKMTDRAGNVQQCSRLYLAYNLDTVPPANPTGTFNLNIDWSFSGNTSKDTTPGLSWNSNNYSEGDSLLTYENTTCAGVPRESGILPWPKAWTVSQQVGSYIAGGSQDGLKEFSVRLKDRAGNVSGCVNTDKSYILDTVPIGITLDSASVPVGTVTGPFLVTYSLSESYFLQHHTNTTSSSTYPVSSTLYDTSEFVRVVNATAHLLVFDRMIQVYVSPLNSGPVTVELLGAFRDLARNVNIPVSPFTVQYSKPVSFMFETGSSEVSEKAGTTSIKIKSSQVLTEAATVSYTVASASDATNAHHNLVSGSAVINAGATEVSIPVTLYDSADPFNRHLIIALNSVTQPSAGRYTIGSIDTHDLIILDDETNGVTFKKITVRSQTSCGIKADDKLYCWGNNTYGQFGDTTTSAKVTPSVAFGGNTILDYAMSGGTVCAIYSNNDLYCAGANSYYEVATNATFSFSTPVLRDSPNKYIKIYSTDYDWNGSFCAITVAGKVKCWGYGSSLHLGTGSSVSKQPPTDVDSTYNYTEISMGDAVCGLTDGGLKRCWGTNNMKIIDDSYNNSYLTPVTVSSPYGTKKLSMGQQVNCWITPSDFVYCRGVSSEMRLGALKISSNGYNENLINFTTFKEVSTNGYGACAISTANKLYCWGTNAGDSQGFLEYQTFSPKLIEPNVDFQKFISRGIFSCAVSTTGKNYCFGSPQQILYSGTLDLAQKSILKSPAIVAAGATGNLYVGDRGGCYTKSNGELFCWGVQQGLLNQDSVSSTPRKTASMLSLSSMTAPDTRGCALSASSDLYCWQAPESIVLADILGTGPYNGYYPANGRFWPALVDAGTKYKKVVAKKHACGITMSNKLRCWGKHSSGEIGIGVAVNSNNLYPNTVDAANDYIDVAVADGRTCAITSLNKIRCWGNSYGSTPVNFDNAVDYKKIFGSGNGSHFCAITVADKVRCWGSSNAYWQIGNSGATITTPVDVDSAETYKTLSLGTIHSCGITGSDQLKCWGGNTEGQIGDGTIITVTSPKVIDSGTSYRAVGLAENKSCAITTGDVLKCWGRRGFGEAGDGFNYRAPRIFNQ